VPRQLLALNIVLLAACALFVGIVVRASRTPWPAPPPARPRPSAAESAAKPPPAEAGGAAAYASIATRNLFSPTRSEAPPTPVTPAATLPKPNLYGVVVREGSSIAYLEDPVTKRVAGYREGDAIAGGTVKTIAGDRVVLVRPEGPVDVRLHDPSRPRPAPPAPAAAAGATPPRAPGAPPAAGAPGAPPAAEAPAGAPAPEPPAAEAPSAPRRTLPPSLLRRLPPGAQSNAPQQ
jgi:Type II secretion system protein C